MPIEANKVICWEPRCDQCGEGDNSEYGESFHYESRAEAVQAVEGADWIVTESGAVICGCCIENEEYPSEDVGKAVSLIVAKLNAGRTADA